MTPLKLRPYQEEALRISKQRWNKGKGVTRQLLALPTGTGKTHIFASLPEHHQIEGKMLVLVHTQEIARQTYDTIHSCNPKLGLRGVGIEMGKDKCTGWEKVVIAGVQSIGRTDSERLRKFPPIFFDVIVCDEAHHSVATTYRNVFEHFGLFDRDNTKLLLGVTATPFRNDQEALHKIYKKIVYKMTILDAILQGWITDIRGFRITTETTKTNLDSVHTRYDDFVVSELSTAINTEARNALVVRDWKFHAENRQTIVYTANISHAQHMAQMFQSSGVPAAAIWGGDPDRLKKVENHKAAGRLKVLCNCAVLTEGYDDWRVGCIVMARPTKSRLLFVQTIGRGLRIQGNIDNLLKAEEQNIPILKKDCLVLDFVDNTRKHDLVNFLSVFGVQLRNGLSLKQVVTKGSSSRNADGEVPLIEPPNIDGIETSADQVDFFNGRKPNPFWKRQKSGSYYLWLKPDGWVRVWQEYIDRWHVEGRTEETGQRVLFRKDSSTMSKAMRLGEEWVSSCGWSPTKPRCRPRSPAPRKRLPCPFCKNKIREGRLHKHMTDLCPQRPNRPQP